MRVLQDHNEVEIHLTPQEAQILDEILEASAVEDWADLVGWESSFVRGLQHQINNILVKIETIIDSIESHG